MTTSPAPVSSRLVALAVLAAAAPPLTGGVALLLGAGPVRSLLLALAVPVGLSALAALGLLCWAPHLARRPARGRSVSPDPVTDVPVPRPAPALERLVDEVVRCEIAVREAEHALVTAVAGQPAYEELLALADRVREAVLARAEAVGAAGGALPPELGDALVLRALLADEQGAGGGLPLPRLEG